jgi:hypothetical protein
VDGAEVTTTDEGAQGMGGQRPITAQAWRRWKRKAA